MRSYAIGDIHGHLDLLKQAHRRIASDRARTGDAEAPVIHVGDLVDRGPDSAGVIDYLLKGQIAGQPWVVLKGNHDRMFAGFMADPDWHDPGLRPTATWLHPNVGGVETLASYGVRDAADRPLPEVHAEARACVPLAHSRFAADLPAFHRRGEVLFVHAGIRPGVPLEAQTEDDLIWIRGDFHDYTAPHPWLIVHGHTPIERATHYGNRVNIDSRAAYGGPLTAVVVEGRAVYRLDEAGRAPLLPTG
jgi:serine/threonine protein phosphatase 1